MFETPAMVRLRVAPGDDDFDFKSRFTLDPVSQAVTRTASP